MQMGGGGGVLVMVGTDGCCVAGFSEHTLRAVEFWRQRAGRMERERGEAVKGGGKVCAEVQAAGGA